MEVDPRAAGGWVTGLFSGGAAAGVAVAVAPVAVTAGSIAPGTFAPGAVAAVWDFGGASVMVLPSALKLANSGTVVVTVIWAAPLISEYVASGMVLLPKVSVGEAGAVTGSWRNVIRSLPGSAATDGLTGAVKWKTRWE